MIGRISSRIRRAVTRAWRRRRVLSSASLRRLADHGSRLAGCVLETTDEAPISAPGSGATLVPVRAVGEPSRRLLLKIGHDDLRQRVREHHVALQRLLRLPELPGSVRRVLPVEHGLVELDDGTLLAVADRAPGVALRTLLSASGEPHAAEQRVLDLLLALQSATRSLPRPDPLPGALARLVESLVESGCSLDTTRHLRAGADAYRRAAEAKQLPAVVSHGAFHPGNILVDPDSGAVTAVLDLRRIRFESFPAFDLFHFLAQRQCQARGATTPEVAERELFVPPEGTWARRQVERYFRTLDIPLKLAPLHSFGYLVERVADHLQHADPRAAEALLEKLAPRFASLAEELA